MRKFIESYWKTIVFFGLIGLLGGFFTGIYLLDSYPAEMQDQLISELMSAGLDQLSPEIAVAIITAIQSAGYGIFLGGIGIVIAKRVGLWKDERDISSKPLLISIGAAIVLGLSMILSDMLYFNNHCEALLNSYATKPSLPYILATVTYGAVIEEVMLRLFAMSLCAFILNWLFNRGADIPTDAVMITSNVITALLFGLGHLPATFIILGNSPMIIARCLLLNGGIGLVFGYLYRKYGFRYAMIAHGGCHIVSKLIWIFFF